MVVFTRSIGLLSVYYMVHHADKIVPIQTRRLSLHLIFTVRHPTNSFHPTNPPLQWNGITGYKSFPSNKSTTTLLQWNGITGRISGKSRTGGRSSGKFHQKGRYGIHDESQLQSKGGKFRNGKGLFTSVLQIRLGSRKPEPQKTRHAQIVTQNSAKTIVEQSNANGIGGSCG